MNPATKNIDIVTFLGHADDKWPVMRNISTAFIKQFDSVVFVSFGKGYNDMNLDTDISEKLAGYWNLVPSSYEDEKYMLQLKYIIVSGNIKNERSDFMKSLTTKLLDADNMIVHSYEQNIGKTIQKLEKIDICKIDDPNYRQIIFEILDRGFRPCFMCIRFEHSPDFHVPTQLIAGHLQNCGYILMGVHENKYLYYFTDNPIYDCCSLVEPAASNPIISEIAKQASLDTANKIFNIASKILNTDRDKINELKQEIGKLIGASCIT